MIIRKQDVLNYHSQGRKGKIEVVPTKPTLTQYDLSLAYTPGVAEPCREIQINEEYAYEYTAKGNLVAVITNGTAVLGLGDIGALAAKPVMEGKGVLFKRFADVDVFDIELNTHNPDELIRAVQMLEPTFGGINLEDIKAPDCFYIEEKLKETMQIPVFHDDQHGTAIISGAALLNALELVGKDIDKVRVVFNGAGAAAIACANFYVSLGVKLENTLLCDRTGVVYTGREKGMNRYKEKFAQKTGLRTLEQAMDGADVFVGLSAKGAVTPAMIKAMSKDPIVFAMANPDPEISYEDAVNARKDVIMATGRSDYPNQINNVLGFPYIFRGALDVRAKAINEEMKKAAAYALASLAQEDVPDSVIKAYGAENMRFGREYIVPKALDPRVLLWETLAVAKAAMKSGVARKQLDIEKYRDYLESRLGKSREVMRVIISKAQRRPVRIVYPEGEDEKILKACQIIVDENIAKPILLGNVEKIQSKINLIGLDLSVVDIVDPLQSKDFDRYTQELLKIRSRKGLTTYMARDWIQRENIYGSMMVHLGDADGLVSGRRQNYPDTIRPALQVIGMRPDVDIIAGIYMMILKNSDVIFFADTTVNIDPTAEQLAKIAIGSAEVAKGFGIEPRIAMLSFSTFGSVKHPQVSKVQKAVQIVKKLSPELTVDGEMQADTAVVPEMILSYPFSDLKEKANILVFPDLNSANISYKLVMRLGGAEAIGPILFGMNRSIHVIQRGCAVNDIVNMTAVAVVDAQQHIQRRLR